MALVGTAGLAEEGTAGEGTADTHRSTGAAGTAGTAGTPAGVGAGSSVSMLPKAACCQKSGSPMASSAAAASSSAGVVCRATADVVRPAAAASPDVTGTSMTTEGCQVQASGAAAGSP